MEKRLIAQGSEKGKSYTIVLPSQWVKEYKLNKTKTVDLQIIENRIIISPKAEKTPEYWEFDGDDVKIILRRLCAALYRYGAKEIRFDFTDPEVFSEIKASFELVLFGFEITEQGKNFCVIKEILSETEEKFDEVLKRSFHLLLLSASEIIEAVKTGNTAQLQATIDRDYTLNRTTNYCERILITRGHPQFKKIPFYFLFLRSLEYMGNEIKGICYYLIERKKKISEINIELLEEINRNIHDFYDLYYDFDLKKANAIGNKLMAMRESPLKLFNQKYDNRIVHHITAFSETLIKQLGNVIVIKLKEK